VIDLSKLSIHFQAALGALVLAVVFAGMFVLQEPILFAWVALATLAFGLFHILAWLCGIVAVVALIVGVFSRPEPDASASAAVDDDADLAPETSVHLSPEAQHATRH
jgi:hypothetical protein